MSIDWLTVGAQLLNFLVLLWLLKRFLYRPILDGIDAREREIAERLSQAAEARELAARTDADLRRRIARLDSDRDDLLAAGREAAAAERRALLDETLAELARERSAREAVREEEARRYTAELQRGGAEALLALLRKALADLADETFEHRLALRTVTRLAASPDALARAAANERRGEVITREPLPEAVRGRLEAELDRVIPDVKLDYRTEPTRSPGLSLHVGGARLDWTLDRYVDALEDELERTRGTIVAPGASARPDAA